MSSETYKEDSFELGLISLFKEMGYTYESGYDIERDYHSAYYEPVLRDSIRKLNPKVSQTILNDAIKKITNITEGTLIQNNEAFMEILQGGVEVPYLEKGEMGTARVKLIDYNLIGQNDFRIVNQWTIEEYQKIRCDMVVFINGLPLVVIELKSPSNPDADVHDAYNQIKHYQQYVPSLFTFNCFNVISDFSESKAGTITASENRYMAWKTKDGNYESTEFADFDTFFQGIFQRDRLIDLIHNFICFDKWEGKTGKILAAYHQYFAVNKAISRTYDAVSGNGKIGVFWHTQGSGKSLSMVFFAHLLIQKFPETTIVVVTDRKDLDGQLFGQFSRCKDFLRQTPDNAKSREDLINLLKNRKSGGIIFTTIQKFEEGNEPLSTRKNIIVMTDEAHRSQYGEEHWDTQAEKMKKGFALKMREALPGASFIGFTGTPISDRDKDTQEVFGNYIDVYDMTQAVADGATRPVYYESRVINLNLDEDVLKQLDAEFDQLAEDGATDEQLDKTKKELSHLEQVLGADSTLDSLVQDILKHYEENRAQELTGKAMIVAYSREIAIKIYKKILALRPGWENKVKVVMSGSNKDPEEWVKIIGTEKDKIQLAKDFKDDDSEMKIAIVRDMWLTGFDVPSLATMYVYKAMSGHNLMQAIARVNRVFPGKEGGLIVDYIGIAQALKKAMHDYTVRDQQKFGNPDIAKTAFIKWQEELEICQDLMHGFDYKAFFTGNDLVKAGAIKSGVNHLLAVDKEEQRKDFIEHSSKLHNATTLCRSLLSVDQKTEVAYMDAVRVLLARFGQKGKISKKEINDRISNLLGQSVKSEGVINLFNDTKTEFSLFDASFMEQIQKMKEKNLAVELLKKLLKEKIDHSKRINVVESEKFSDLLNMALSQYIKGMLTNQEVIEELIKMAKQLMEEELKGNALGLTDTEKAFYDALTKPQAVKDFYTNEQLVELTRELTDALQKNRTIDWNHKESARAKMRIMIKRLLKKFKYPPEGAEEALNIVMKQCDHWADDENNFTEEAPAAKVVKLYEVQEEGTDILKAAEEE